jgi:two-component system phosphate regulon sensor histidine kinase PhoR
LLESRFLRKLCASYFLLVLVTATLIGWLVNSRMENELLAGLERSLEHDLAYLEPFALECFRGQHQGVGQRIGLLARETDTRITLILPDGRVLADSDEDPALMDDHGQRPEVLAARTAAFGAAQRESRTTGHPTKYVAHVVGDGREEGIIRLALPIRVIGEQLAAVRQAVIFGALVGLAVSLALGYLVARRITAPITAITEVAEEMRGGVYTRPAPGGDDDEFGILADTLNRMGADIQRKLRSITEDRARLEAIVSGIVEGVVAVDAEDRVLYCNSAAARLFDIDPASAEGQPFEELFRAPGLGDLLRQARDGGSSERSEVRLEGDERVLSLEVNATPFAAGDSRGVVMVLHDITGIRALERVRRDFVANVSHELKTPLTSIKGYVETLLDGAADEAAMRARFLEKIQKNADRLSHLVSDLLSLSRIESEQDVDKREPLDWAEMLQDAARRHEDAVRQKSLQLEVRPAAEPVVVLGDREAVIEILDNLLDNAIKYSPTGGRIRLVLSRGEESGTLTVEDTGAGIPEEDLDRIFERFYRVDKARSRELGGSGLGLSIVKHLVQAMEGEVSVRSRVGEGSCFTVRLPLAG